MTFTTELFKLIESDASMWVGDDKIEVFEPFDKDRERFKVTDPDLWRVTEEYYGNWWDFKDQEVVVNYQGICSARDIMGHIVTLEFTVASYRPVELKDLK